MWSTGAHCEQLTPSQQWDGVIIVGGQRLHKVKLPTASSYARPTAVMVMLCTADSWPASVHGHVTHCRQLYMASTCTLSCYALPTVTTTLHGANSQNMAKLCVGNSYMWPAVICGLIMYSQRFHSANNNVTLQQQGLAARGVLRGVLKGLGRVLDLCGEPWCCVCVVSHGVVCAGSVVSDGGCPGYACGEPWCRVCWICVVSYVVSHGVVCAGYVCGELWCCVRWAMVLCVLDLCVVSHGLVCVALIGRWNACRGSLGNLNWRNHWGHTGVHRKIILK